MNLNSLVPFNEHYVVRAGAHGYGLEDETSDLDLRGFFFPDEDESVLGFVAYPGHWNGEGDFTMWDVRRFFALAAKANPNVIETLFVEAEDLVSITPLAKIIRDKRDMFLSRRLARTTIGYAISCMERIKKAWDPKDCSHAFRLLYMGTECMRTGRLVVKRSGQEREFLLDIKRSLTPPVIMDYMFAKNIEIVKGLIDQCPLPEEPDEKALNSLLSDLMREHLEIQQ